MFALTACSSEGGLASPVGDWRSEENPEVTLTIDEDGSVSGSDGCNRIVGGEANISGSDVEFNALATTLMFCEGVDTWLSTATSATVDGETLNVYGVDGTEIGKLVR